jgi:Bacillus haemolytic enterotoxin (HBL)
VIATPAAATAAPDVMADGAGSVFAAALVLDVQAPAIAGQWPLDLPLVPTVSQTQALAARHAGLWLDVYAPQLMQALDDVRTYGATVVAFAPELTAAAATLGRGRDAEALDVLLSGIGHLGQIVSSRRQGIAANRTAITAFAGLVDDDSVRYVTDASLMRQRYTGPDGDITAIEKELDDLGARLRKDNEEIALGAAKALPAALIIGVGAGVAYIDTSVGKAIVQKGIEMGRGAIKDADAAMDDAAEAIRKYKAAAEKLSGERQQIAVFTTLNGHVMQLSHGSSLALSALDGLDRAWQAEIEVQALWNATARGTGASTLSSAVTAVADLWTTRSAGVLTLIGALDDLK